MELIRKISVGKWQRSLEVGPDHISADAITACLRTSNNTLSVWKFEGEDEYNASLLALLSSLSSLDTIDVLRIKFAELESVGLQLAATPGKTPAESYIGLHRDIVDLDYDSLKLVANLVKGKVERGEAVRITRPAMKRILTEAVAEKIINEHKLHDKLRKELGLENDA